MDYWSLVLSSSAEAQEPVFILAAGIRWAGEGYGSSSLLGSHASKEEMGTEGSGNVQDHTESTWQTQVRALTIWYDSQLTHRAQMAPSQGALCMSLRIHSHWKPEPEHRGLAWEKMAQARPLPGCMSSDESLELSASQKSLLSTGITAVIIPGCFLMLYVRPFPFYLREAGKKREGNSCLTGRW